MSEDKTSTNRENLINRIRIVAVVLGIALALFGLFADALGLSSGGDVGTGQLLLVGAGVIIAILGVLGKHVTSVYRATAFMLLNIVILFVIVEIVGIGLDRFASWQRSRELLAPTFEQQTYQEADWASEYFAEFSVLSRRYNPFTIWRLREFEGDAINIGEDGLRATPGANCDEDAFRVFVLGGSTVWGTGSPDWLTIPAFIQAGLDAVRDDAVCVINFGEGGYVVTQEVIALMWELQQGNIPDLVIFYDGANDIFAAYQNQAPHLHQNIWEVSSRFENRNAENAPTFTNWLLNTRIGDFVRDLTTPPPQTDAAGIGGDITITQEFAIDEDAFAEEITNSYINSYRMVEGIANEFGFDFYFFWQPVIFATEKELSEAEQTIFETQFAGVRTLTEKTYEKIASVVNEYPNMHYIADVFDGMEETIYIDFVHINPQGNEIVAERILEVIEQ